MTGAAPIAYRRASVLDALAILEREAGAAALDGQTFDGGPILAAHSELAVLDAAEAEADRRAREAAEAEAHADRVKAAGEAAHELKTFRAAIAAADENAQALAGSLSAALKAARGLKRLGPRLRVRVPLELDPAPLAKALSLALGESLASVEHPRSLGYLAWPSSPARQGWELATRNVADTFQPVIEGLTA